MHEPGTQTVIGKRYDAAGVEQGRLVLADLARHPATATHVASTTSRVKMFQPQTRSTFETNFIAAATSRKPITTFTEFSQPPDRGS